MFQLLLRKKDSVREIELQNNCLYIAGTQERFYENPTPEQVGVVEDIVEEVSKILEASKLLD